MKFQLQPMNVKLMQSEEAAQLGLFKFSPCLSLRSIKYERRRPKCFREVLTTRAIALIYLYTKFECCLEKYQHECWFISKFGKYWKKYYFCPRSWLFVLNTILTPGRAFLQQKWTLQRLTKQQYQNNSDDYENKMYFSCSLLVENESPY